MSNGGPAPRPDFEDAWRRRFEEFATLRDDDAGIAGWSVSGLDVRFRHFVRAWQGSHLGKTWLDAGCGGSRIACRNTSECPAGQTCQGFRITTLSGTRDLGTCAP